MKDSKCKACGKCCEYIILNYPKTDMYKEWAQARGFKVHRINEAHIEYRLFHPCPHLKNHKCDIHHNKPVACELFPERLPPIGAVDYSMLPDKCAYKEGK